MRVVGERSVLPTDLIPDVVVLGAIPVVEYI